MPDQEVEKIKQVDDKQNPKVEDTKVKQVSEFEKKEIFDPTNIAALIDKSKENLAETDIISDKITDSFIIKASMKEYLQLTVYAFLGMAFSQFLWLLGIKKIGLGLASIHMNATAFYVMIILSFFGGSWNNYQLVGALIVGIGVFISQSSKKSFIT